MKTNIASQIPKNLMFRYRLPCHATNLEWSNEFKLGPNHQLRGFGEFENQQPFADVRAAWNSTGLFFTVDVSGKKQTPWCRANQLLDSDGLQIWIDTRATHNVHRASRFCHWFGALPAGDGARNADPVASMLKINRAKEDSPTLNRGHLAVASKVRKSGYSLKLRIESNCLNGWNTAEHRKIGFSFAVIDRELGWQSLGVGPELPVGEDPSLWHVLDLVE